MTRNVDPLQMRVGEAKQRDIGKKRARIGPDAMDYLQVTPGDVIQINAKRSTCAIVWPTDEDEKYPDTIRIDGQTRKNLGVALSDVVEINKVNFRYIELMQTGDNLDYFNKYHVSSKIFKSYLNDNNWIYQTQGLDAGPSLNYINPDYKGKFGIIAPYSKDFCKSCNRLRITSKGDLRLCLFGNTGISIRHLLQKDDQTYELKDLILGQMRFKKESHYLELGETGLTKNLSKTGG